MAKFKVEFKEAYMPHAVERICDVPNEAEIIRFYCLEDPDIEWYKITKIE